MKLTTEQKHSIKSELLTKVKNAETRSRIISTAYGFANKNGQDGDLESMIAFLMDPNNSDKLDDLYDKYSMSIPYATEIETSNTKDKK